ncbi:MAG: carotene hydroxylase [Candidatus Marinimicrobia bacterium]|nr:carotene hydroxylase [Candidatus Neomarinimicrobiota bacterium]|tara:strand:- start:172 stop:618 length:447 start_codon:yes stop_codon:yes gene_type:complete
MLNAILITITSFMAMEFIAWATHKFLMHGPLWILHEDHHVLTGKWYQKNDSFALIFAIPSISCFFVGSFLSPKWLVFVGLGILLYGIAYMLVHDIFIHRRIKLFKKPKNSYLKGLLLAHRKHHVNLGKYDCEYFGMLFVPPKLIKSIK